MDYVKIYQSLINKARNTQYKGYTEVHHIIPRCMGGTDDPLNLVTISPEEHHTAHLLLVKIHPNNHKLVHAASMMTRGKYRNNKLYGWIRRKLAIAASEKFKGIPKGPFTDEHKKNISEAKKGYVPTPESNKKRSDALKGKTSPMKGKVPWNKGKKGVQVSTKKGKTLTNATKDKIREARKLQVITEEAKAKQSQTMKHMRISCLGCKKEVAHGTFYVYHKSKCF